MEYAERGSLLNYLRSLRPSEAPDSVILKCTATKDEERFLSEQTMWNFAVQVMRGMKHIVSHKCIHRDLAARNVLVSKGFQLKICDFGMAKDVTYHDYYRRVSPGILPLKWTAPEAAVDKLFTQYSDV
jgi:serine/threonine protein kinase